MRRGRGGGWGNREKEREGKGEERDACNKNPNWFNSAVPGGRKISIGQSDKFPRNQSCRIARS